MLGNAFVLQPCLGPALNALEALSIRGLQIPIRLFQIELRMGRQQLGNPAALPLPHAQLHQPFVPHDAFLIQAKLLAYPLRRLTGTTEGAGIEGPARGLSQEICQAGPHGEGLGFAPGGQIRVAASLQPQFGVVTGLAVAQQIEGSRHGFSCRFNEITKAGDA
ncbi:hypothetical protein D3C79_749740 [compost metagenome]